MPHRLNEDEWGVVRSYFETVQYALLDHRLSFDAPPDLSGFPDFGALRSALSRLDPVTGALFRLFRAGEAVDEEAARRALPERVAGPLRAAGLLVPAPGGGVRTADLLLVPIEGLLLLVGSPTHYPTCAAPEQAPFSVSSAVVARALPGNLSGLRALDVCSGSGLHALLCAARGAELALGLELNAAGVETARANAALNGLAGRVEFRCSDALSALSPDETFDFVVCNTPYGPMLEGPEPPLAAEFIGNNVQRRLAPRLARHLTGRARGVIAAWSAPGQRGETLAMLAWAAELRDHGFDVTGFADRTADTTDSVLARLRQDLARRPDMGADQIEPIIEAARAALFRAEPRTDGYYNQFICFAPRGADPALPPGSVYGFGLEGPGGP